MKKLLGSALAVAFLFMASQARADLLKNLKFNGSIEMDATSANNVLDFNTSQNDRISAAQTRVMLGMDWNLLDDVHAVVTLSKNDRVYGSGDGESIGSNHGQSLTQIENTVYVEQAYFKIDKVFGRLDSTFGRQFYGDEGDLIIYYGPHHNQYGMTVTAIDAGRFDWNAEKFYVTGVVGKGYFAGNNIASYGADIQYQQDLRGLVAGTKGIENVDGKIYLWNALTHMTGNTTFEASPATVANDNLYVLGLKVKGKYLGAYGSFEIAQNFGSSRYNPVGPAPLTHAANYCGRAFLFDLGYKADVANVGNINPWGELGIGTGGNYGTGADNNFYSIASDYRPGAIYGRFDQTAALLMAWNVYWHGANDPASSGLTNRVIWGVGVKTTPTYLNKLTAGLAYWDYRFQQMYPNETWAAGNRHIGGEYDLTAEWKHSENVTLSGALGTFQPGGHIKDQTTPGCSPAFLANFNAAVKF